MRCKCFFPSAITWNLHVFHLKSCSYARFYHLCKMGSRAAIRSHVTQYEQLYLPALTFL